jgi:ATP-dependent exoDNAse (exonuclease V) alpha subunit
MTGTFEFTEGQKRALSHLKEFIDSDHARVFILKGYAGTGKTTLVKELIKILQEKKKSFKLLASTGRAAKILSNITDCPASTVHSEIYTYKDFNLDLENVADERASKKVDNHGQLYLEFELVTVLLNDNTIHFYIVDESSMIGDRKEKVAIQASFGSGRLLNDLLAYDANGKFIFVGDVCQLPPINETFSPALSVEYFQHERKIECLHVELTEIVRQDIANDIILASQKIRKLYASCPPVKWAKFPFRGCKNITIFGDQASMLAGYVKRIKHEGYNNATLICRSNKLCDTLTSLIRPALGFVQPTLQKGDLLLVTQNNYISNLMNGDLVEVINVGIRENRAHLTFLRIEVKEIVTQKVYSQLLIENILYQNQTNLMHDQQKELFMDYYDRMYKKGIAYKKNPQTPKEHSDKRLFEEGMRKDIYLNALRAVFGFALTCHKSQGGEWEHVYLDIPRALSFSPQQETYQWLYTAMTRAKKQLYVVEGFWLI